MFSLRSLVTGAVALMAAPVMAANMDNKPHPNPFASALHGLADKSRDLQGLAKRFNDSSIASILAPKGPLAQVITGLDDITATAAGLSRRVGGPRVSRPEADNILSAYREFVSAHEGLLDILIRKSGLVKSYPVVCKGVADALRENREALKELALRLIDEAKSVATDLKELAESLDYTLGISIAKYKSIPVVVPHGGTHGWLPHGQRPHGGTHGRVPYGPHGGTHGRVPHGPRGGGVIAA